MILNDRDMNYLLKISEYCDRIREARNRFGDTFEAFIDDPDYRDVICMNIFQIGELANQLSEDIRELTPDVPWVQMYGIRNILAHAYIKIDSHIIWQTVTDDIPKLKSKLDKIL